MKKILLLAGLALSLGAGFKSEAQVRVNVQIGAPVVRQSWYANDNDYYYMPDHGVYYNVQRRVYVYPQGGSWVYADRLPTRFGGASYRSGRYVRIRERAPFMRHDMYRSRYAVVRPRTRTEVVVREYGRDNRNERRWDNDRRYDRDRNFNGGGGGNGYHYNRR